MQEILPLLQAGLEGEREISFEVLDPDLAQGYAGERREIAGEVYLSRGYKAWVDLAELLKCKMLTPQATSYPLIRLRFEKLLIEDSFHTQAVEDQKEKYGVASPYFEIQKMEEPAFLYYYLQALNNVKIEQRKKILNLGINRADEFAVIKEHLDPEMYAGIEFVGIDHASSAIAYAKELFPEPNMTFYTADINHLERLELGKFDLLISIGTLQSSTVAFKPLFMSLIQEYMSQDAAIILGFPNARWIAGEMIYGAKVPNYAMSELGLLYSDVMFVKKYLQQKQYRVTITGKQYIFLTATKITPNAG